jgi:PAS domain S-box-containing protein
MEDSLSYDQLFKRYQELQLRVTRFSSIEQSLINVRDKLDQELVVYKKLNNFNSQGLKSKEIDQFLRLIAETVIDIFEIEIGYASFQEYEQDDTVISEAKKIIFLEGAGQFDVPIIQEIEFLTEQNIFGGKVKHYENSELIAHLPETNLSTCILTKKLKIGIFGELVIAGAVGIKKAANYKEFDSRSAALFSVFVQQSEAYLSNMLAVNKNREQLELIMRSEIELKKLSLIATRAKSGVIISDKYGNIEWVNNSFSETTGYTLEEVKGMKPKDFLQTDDPINTEAKDKLSNALRKKEAIEVIIQNRTKTGRFYFNQLEITPIFNEKGELLNFIAIQKDISEEVRYKKQLENINSRFELVTEGANIGIWEDDLVHRKTIWNDVLLNIYGISNHTTESLFEIWQESIHPDDREKMNMDLHNLFTGQVAMTRQEYRIIVKNLNNEERFVRSLAIVEKDENNNVIRILGTTIDITEAHNSEQRILEKNEELMKINGELDQFVYSVSHDLRSPLMSIKGILSLIDTVESEEERQMYLSLIAQSVSRLDNTILEILDYSRNARMEEGFSSFNFKEMIQNIFDDLSYITNDPVELKLVINGPEEVEMDKPRMDILMKNLISNGIKYRRQSNEVSFVQVTLDSDETSYSVSILDNGEGISEENQLRVFDMFYRASTSTNGTGLGLYICKDIVAKMKGTLKLSSEAGKGTEISISLPKKQTHESLPSH